MATGNGTQNLRKAMGVLKDTTKVGIARVNSDYKELDVAIVKATNHDEVLPKEKHVRTIFRSISSSSPRADVAYCIHALARRLGKTRTWTVALKTLVVIHRGMREVDPTFREELSNYDYSRGHLLNLAHFKDDSSSNAWYYSAWVRSYALYLEEFMECFRVLKYDFQKERSRSKELDTPDLLEQLPALQQLLFRLLACQPEGAARYNYLIQCALSIVVTESVGLYVTITDGIVNLVDKFFEMQRRDAVRALEIYKKAGNQAESLSEFLEMCRALDFGRGQKHIKIEQPPASFITVMEEYVQDAPQTLMLPWRENDIEKLGSPKVITVAETIDNKESSDPTFASDEVSENRKSETAGPPLMIDLLGLDDLSQETSEVDDRNALALAIITPEDQSNTATRSDLMSQSTSWELALVTTPSSDLAAVTGTTLGGALDRSTLDSLYNIAQAQTNVNGTYHLEEISSNPFEVADYPQEPFYAPNSMNPATGFEMTVTAQQQETFMQQQEQFVAAHDSTNSFVDPATGFEMAVTAQQQEAFMQQQEQFMVAHDSTNSFGNPFVDQGTLSSPSQCQSPYPGLI